MMSVKHRRRVMGVSFFTLLMLFVNHLAIAGEVDVLKVKAKCNKKAQCNFTVRVKHKDKGWQHYVNRWEVLSMDGDVLAVRQLAHPHVKEQPFTRTLFKAAIPEEHKSVIVRAHDSVHGYGGKEVTVILRE